MDAAPPVTSPPRWKQAVLCLGALFPFAASLGFHAAGPSARPVAHTRATPGLAFDQYAVNLGPIEPTPYAFASFRFTNVGSETVKITGLTPSCGCLQPQLAKWDYEPGESGRFHLRIQTAKEPSGPKEETVRIVYEDPEPREVTLTFKVVLPEDKVFVTPKALFFYQLGSGPTEQKIYVTDRREQGLRVTRVESTLDHLITAELLPADETEQAFQSVVSVHLPAEVPPGTHAGHIVLTTDDPEYPELTVPVRVQGRRLTDPARFSARNLLRRH